MNRTTRAAPTQKRGAKFPQAEERAAAQGAPAKTVARAAKAGSAQAKPASRPRQGQASAAGGQAMQAAQSAESMAATLDKAKRPKLVRDSFTMPEVEYQALVDIKKTCLQAGLLVKKSELLRIGIVLARELDVAEIKRQQSRLTPLAPGRPKKHKKDASKADKKS